MEDTTTIAAESFLTEQTEVEAILSAAGVLGVELKLIGGRVTATGKVSRLESSTTWEEVETALAMVIEAVGGRVIGYDDAQHFVEQAKQRARFIPAAGAVGG